MLKINIITRIIINMSYWIRPSRDPQDTFCSPQRLNPVNFSGLRRNFVATINYNWSKLLVTHSRSSISSIVLILMFSLIILPSTCILMACSTWLIYLPWVSLFTIQIDSLILPDTSCWIIQFYHSKRLNYQIDWSNTSQ